MEVGQYASERRALRRGIVRSKNFKPMRNEKIIVETFDFNLPVIIFDLKKGVFKDDYSSEKTLLLFKQENEMLDVSEINPFVKAFLESCSGDATLKEISRRLYGRYGEDTGPAEFLEAWVEAAEILAKNNLIW